MDEAKSDVGSSGDEVLDDTLGETGGPLSDGAMERKRLLAPEQTTNALSPFCSLPPISYVLLFGLVGPEFVSVFAGPGHRTMIL